MAKGISGFRLDKGWNKYAKATNAAKFKREFAKQRKIAFDKIAKTAVREAVNGATGFARNADLTLALKGNKAPMQDSDRFLRKSVSTVNASRDTVFVGIPRSNKKAFGIGSAIHEPTAIKVTDKMRMMFFALAAVSRKEASPSILRGRARALYRRHKRPWYPLAASTKVIRIKGRPFMAKAFESDILKKDALHEMQRATNQVFRNLIR